MRVTEIGKRLLSAAEFVRQGAYFADIGTDHAYLPLFLLEKGTVEGAVCVDVNEGPLKSAEANARERGLTEKITFILSDGAEKLSGMGVTDVAICGMGGELIAGIIDRAPFLRDPNIRLILQPMTKQSELRRFLARNGFSVIGESYSYDSGKYYVCLCAFYSGEFKELSPVEAEFGKFNEADEFSPAKLGYFEAKKHALQRAINGKRLGGEDVSYAEEILSEISKYVR